MDHQSRVPDPPTFVLVHGGWLGGWYWDRVRPLLERAGHRVLTPTLAGLGERTHLADPVPSLATHVQDVVATIEAEELANVVLVGHSYGGMVITAVADRLKPRLTRLVYLDAAVPADGADFAAHVPGTSEEDAERRRAAFRGLSEDGVWLSPPSAAAAGIHDAADAEWVARQLTPHPLRTWLDPVKFQNGGHVGVAKTYVLATAPPTTVMGYPRHAEVAQRGGEWTYREIACGHGMMIIDPVRTAELLMEAAAAPAAETATPPGKS